MNPSPNAYLDPALIDWRVIRRATFEVRQSIRYEYPGPIHDLRQVLVLVPHDQHGAQQLLTHSLDTAPDAAAHQSTDRFGNRICHVAIARVEREARFDVALKVERWAGEGPLLQPGEAAMFLAPGALTMPEASLARAAADIERGSDGPAGLAGRIMERVFNRLTYTQGVTGVKTAAHDALALGKGVCQDYAHIMLTLCRLLGLPARYVSGHLLGEGAMHAWVQVLLPVEGHRNAELAWHAYDPTHNRRAGLPYITIAVGRDYADVSPTRGTFRAPYGGRLAGGHKVAGVLAVE